MVIDAGITMNGGGKRRILHYAYIGYQKAFDGVPHSWLLHILEVYKAHPQIIQFLEDVIKKWETIFTWLTRNAKVKSKPILINWGIFQSDLLSPLWFCISLNPLSNILHNMKYGYKICGENLILISHLGLLYVDDLKSYLSTDRQ